jgi:Protein of unknown function (DUF2793)
MGWWFGRESAAADARPYVPAWLQNEATEVGFARFYSEQYEEVYRRNPVGQRAAGVRDPWEPRECFLVDVAPTADWAGKANCIAAFTSGGWRFDEPVEGLTAYVKSLASWANFRDGAWEIGQVRGSALARGGRQVIGSQAAAIPPATGGSTVDAEARQTLDLILDALRQHGLIET